MLNPTNNSQISLYEYDGARGAAQTLECVCCLLVLVLLLCAQYNTQTETTHPTPPLRQLTSRKHIKTEPHWQNLLIQLIKMNVCLPESIRLIMVWVLILLFSPVQSIFQTWQMDTCAFLLLSPSLLLLINVSLDCSPMPLLFLSQEHQPGFVHRQRHWSPQAQPWLLNPCFLNT